MPMPAPIRLSLIAGESAKKAALDAQTDGPCEMAAYPDHLTIRTILPAEFSLTLLYLFLKGRKSWITRARARVDSSQRGLNPLVFFCPKSPVDSSLRCNFTEGSMQFPLFC